MSMQMASEGGLCYETWRKMLLKQKKTPAMASVLYDFTLFNEPTGFNTPQIISDSIRLQLTFI